ncbi:MAG: GIY-YIG nuclease family protein [Verrucomicrobia bacterium]|nr:GIY-YIG nuclease family protein [Verrucomicrobiota bacterium]MBU1910112.1 GIY-YIG nuclease family protein [Verrucomicrobiota bacterium]
MYYVYFLRSQKNPAKTYVGQTENVLHRLQQHNEGRCVATTRHRPWELMAYVAVKSAARARELERYFKSGSGHAFWHKRFVS